MSDRYDSLLLKARSEMIGKTILRKGVSSDTVFNSVWDDVIKGPGFIQGMKESFNAPQGGPRAWWKQRKQIKGLDPERRKEWDALQEQHRKENEVTPQKFADKHRDLIRDVQAPKPTPKVDAMRADMAKPRDNSRLIDMAQSVQTATPPSLPTDNTTAGQLGRRSEKRSAELQGLKGGVNVPKATGTPPSVDPNKDTIHQQYLSDTQRMTVPKAQEIRDKALNDLKQKDIGDKVDRLPMPPADEPPADEPPTIPDYLPHGEGIHTSPPPAATPPAKKEEPKGAARGDITRWPGIDPVEKISPDDDVSLLPFGLIKDMKPPQEGASDYSLLPSGWAEGGVS